MKAVLINQYTTVSKTTGNRVEMSVYEIVEATQQELEDYCDFETARGYYKETDEGNPIFQTIGDLGNTIEVRLGKKKDANGNLVEAYRGIASEDWRLKKSIVREQISAPAPRVIASRPVPKTAGEPKF